MTDNPKDASSSAEIQGLANPLETTLDLEQKQLKSALTELGQQHIHLFTELANARKNKEFHKEAVLVSSIIKVLAKILPDFAKMRFDSIHDGNLYLENIDTGKLSKENLSSFIEYFGVDKLISADELKYFSPSFDKGYNIAQVAPQKNSEDPLREFLKINEFLIKTIYKYKKSIHIAALQENIDHLLKAALENPKISLPQLQNVTKATLDATGVNLSLTTSTNLTRIITLTEFLEQLGGLEIIAQAENKGAPEIREILDKPYHEMPIKELRYEFGKAHKALIASIYKDKKQFNQNGLQENFASFLQELKEQHLNYLLAEENNLLSNINNRELIFFDTITIKESGAKLELQNADRIIASFSISEFLEKFGSFEVLVEAASQGQPEIKGNTEIKDILDSSYNKLRGYKAFLSVKGAVITGLTAIILAVLSGHADELWQLVLRYIHKIVQWYK